MTFTRIYPCWALDREERRLSALAARGQRFAGVDGAVYLFEKDAPEELEYAVEYAGRGPDSPDALAAKAAEGWEFAGRFGKKRYYRRPRAESGAPHPSFGSVHELERLHTVQSNVMTAILMNIPGTVYCAIYLALLFSGGFYIGEIMASRTVIYPLGLLLGAASFSLLFRWLFALNKRIKKITKKERDNT